MSAVTPKSEPYTSRVSMGGKHVYTYCITTGGAPSQMSIGLVLSVGDWVAHAQVAVLLQNHSCKILIQTSHIQSFFWQSSETRYFVDSWIVNEGPNLEMFCDEHTQHTTSFRLVRLCWTRHGALLVDWIHNVRAIEQIQTAKENYHLLSPAYNRSLVFPDSYSSVDFAVVLSWRTGPKLTGRSAKHPGSSSKQGTSSRHIPYTPQHVE